MAPAIDHFCRVTTSYRPGLFHCYAVPDLPRTNNALEQCFGSARYHARRIMGRKAAPASLVVRGAVRLVTLVAIPTRPVTVDDLGAVDHRRWRNLRRELAVRHDARRAQLRFRRQPAVYLAQLEAQLLKSTLPV